jgi:hypothetical protein
VRLVLEFGFPILLIVAGYLGIVLLDVRRPAARALGCILYKLCVVSSDEIQRYCGLAEEDSPIDSDLRRELRWQQICVIWGYLREMVWNTRLFQQATRFEKMKIDPNKSGLDYEPRERLALHLVDESAGMRWLLFKWQAGLLLYGMFGLKVDQQVLIELLARYKHLEQEMLALAGMAEDDCYYAMLVERLGLNAWGVYEGGSSTPD